MTICSLEANDATEPTKKPGRILTCGREGTFLPRMEDWLGSETRVRVIRRKQNGTPGRKLQTQMARRVPWKCIGDELFVHDPHRAWNEAWACEVNQPLVHLDFNAMYPSCALEGKLPNPAELEVIAGNERSSKDSGIWVCRLRLKSTEGVDWFRNHHFLRYSDRERTSPFLWQRGIEIETLLHTEDIYSLEEFCEIEVLWGIGCREENLIPHPMEHALRLAIKAREEAKRAGNESAAMDAKLEANRICTTRRREWGELEQPNFQRIFGGTGHPSGKGPSREWVYCLSNAIVARGRNKLWRLAVALEKAGWHICQCHTDGLWATGGNPEQIQPAIEACGGSLGTDPGQIKTQEGSRGLFLSPLLWWVKTPTEIKHSGTKKGKPFNLISFQEDGQEYNHAYLFENGKLLRRSKNQEREWAWQRLDPDGSVKKTKRRFRTMNSKIKLLQKFEASVQRG